MDNQIRRTEVVLARVNSAEKAALIELASIEKSSPSETLRQLIKAEARRVGVWPVHNQLDVLRAVEPGPTEEIDENQLGMICRTSIDYVQRYIQNANLATLRAALNMVQATLVRSLEAQIRVREKEVVDVSGKQFHDKLA